MEIKNNLYYHFPKPLLKSTGFTLAEKALITVALQYYNAGIGNQCTLNVIAKNTGTKIGDIKSAYDSLAKDGFAEMEGDSVVLNYILLFNEGVLEYENFFNPAVALKSKNTRRRA